jgi:transketolase
LAQQLAVSLLARGVVPSRFVSLHARGYPNGLYGDQKYHQQLSGLDPVSIQATLSTLL